jgi:hypothetical protein
MTKCGRSQGSAKTCRVRSETLPTQGAKVFADLIQIKARLIAGAALTL